MKVQFQAWPRELECRVREIIAEHLRTMPEVQETFRDSVAYITAFDVMRAVWAETFPDTIKEMEPSEVLPVHVLADLSPKALAALRPPASSAT